MVCDLATTEPKTLRYRLLHTVRRRYYCEPIIYPAPNISGRPFARRALVSLTSSAGAVLSKLRSAIIVKRISDRRLGVIGDPVIMKTISGAQNSIGAFLINGKQNGLIRQLGFAVASSSMVIPTSLRMPRSVPLARSRFPCTGTVVPRPSGCRMM
jgi:hypothetical protein